MISGRPSRTALGVAIRRAAHQRLDHPLVLVDPIAPLILSSCANEVENSKANENSRFSKAFRAFIVARSRITEDELASAVNAGVRQYVLLGAGLDTFAHRNPHPTLRVFEVDHPATQTWKIELLRNSGIENPRHVVYVPVDFDTQSIPDRLKSVEFDFGAPAVFAWLGVVPYLTLDAFRDTLQMIGSLPPGSTVVFDYALPMGSLGWNDRFALRALSQRVARAGEPFRLFLTPEELSQHLTAFHFTKLLDLDWEAINRRYFANRSDGLQLRGKAGRVMVSSV